MADRCQGLVNSMGSLSGPTDISMDLYRQSLLRRNAVVNQSADSLKAEAIGMTGRIKSAMVTEQDVNNMMRAKKENSLHKFRPVTSQPPKTSFTRIQSLGSPDNSGSKSSPSIASGKLPTLQKSSPSSHAQLAALNVKRRRGFRSFIQSNYTKPAFYSDDDPDKKSLSAILASSSFQDNHFKGAVLSTAFPASATWAKAHAAITANGQGILPSESNPTPRSGISGENTPKSSSSGTQLSFRSAVNYVPLYELRGRGDGASVVDAPSIDIEGRKIESNNKLSDIPPRTLTAPKPKKSASPRPLRSAPLLSEGSRSLHVFPASSNNNDVDDIDEIVDQFVNHEKSNPSFLRTVGTMKTEKKVRFSATVKGSHATSFEKPRPAVKEGFSSNNDVNVSTAASGQPSPTSSPKINKINEYDDSVDTESIPEEDGAKEKDDDEEEDDFIYAEPITPVVKVVVTKRLAPTGGDGSQSTPASTQIKEPEDFQKDAVHFTSTKEDSKTSRQRVSFGDVQKTVHDRRREFFSKNLRRGTIQRHRPASTVSDVKSTDAMVQLTKLVPKRQTVVMPNFPNKTTTVTPKRDFPIHSPNHKLKSAIDTSTSRKSNETRKAESKSANSSKKLANDITIKRGVNSASIDKKPSPGNLRSRLNLLSKTYGNASAMTPKTNTGNPRPATEQASRSNTNQQRQESIKAPPASDANATTRNSTSTRHKSATAAPGAAAATTLYSDFQPIPSIPDHINFCDARKTEQILRWLDDVNKKRNIEGKLKRKGVLSLAHTT